MTLELTDEEHRALVRLLRRSIDEDRFPLAPRHAPIKAILAKLEPTSATTPTAATVPSRRSAEGRPWEAETVSRYNGPPMTPRQRRRSTRPPDLTRWQIVV